MNTLFQDDSNDSEDLSDEFSRFLVLNDLNEEEEQKRNLTQDELESSISASDLLAVFDDYDDDSDDDEVFHFS